MEVKKLLGAVFMSVFLLSGIASAQDSLEDYESRMLNEPMANAMPVLGPGEYGTDNDNQNNSGTGTPDYDMDTYLFNTSTKHPIEFDIYIPAAANPKASAATLRMNVYDIDSPDEVDTVYVNGKYVGALNGRTDVWGINYFDIPVGTLYGGKNRIKVLVDRKHVGYWATNIEWGIIKISKQVTITRAWIAPIFQKRGMYVNFYATISNRPARVVVYDGSTYLCDLKDADWDRTWSGQYYIPTTWAPGWHRYINIRALNSTGGLLSLWPGFTVQP